MPGSRPASAEMREYLVQYIAGRQQHYIVIGSEAMYEFDRLRPRNIVWIKSATKKPVSAKITLATDISDAWVSRRDNGRC